MDINIDKKLNKTNSKIKLYMYMYINIFIILSYLIVSAN